MKGIAKFVGLAAILSVGGHDYNGQVVKEDAPIATDSVTQLPYKLLRGGISTRYFFRTDNGRFIRVTAQGRQDRLICDGSSPDSLRFRVDNPTYERYLPSNKPAPENFPRAA